MELDPKNADAYEALGRVYLDTGKIEDAIESLESALNVDPQRKRVLGAIGDAFFSAGRWDEAVRRYEKALKEAPELTYVYYKLGRACVRARPARQGHRLVQEGHRRRAGEPMAYYYLGFSYKERGKKKDAVAAFKKYLELKPNADDKREIEDEIAALEQRLAGPPRRPLPGVAGQVQLAGPVRGDYKRPPCWTSSTSPRTSTRSSPG